MKTFVERYGARERPGRGYLAPCAACGLVVVHAASTRQPFHMHRWSARCRALAAARDAEPQKRTRP